MFYYKKEVMPCMASFGLTFAFEDSVKNVVFPDNKNNHALSHHSSLSSPVIHVLSQQTALAHSGCHSCSCFHHNHDELFEYNSGPVLCFRFLKIL